MDIVTEKEIKNKRWAIKIKKDNLKELDQQNRLSDMLWGSKDSRLFVKCQVFKWQTVKLNGCLLCCPIFNAKHLNSRAQKVLIYNVSGI